MKKLLFIFVLLFTINISAVFAQKLQAKAFDYHYFSLPREHKYLNYRTYGLYVYMLTEADYHIDGFYNPFDEFILKSDTVNGDFKMLVKVKNINFDKKYYSKDTLFITAKSVLVNYKIYDKTGECFYDKDYNVGNAGASLPGVEKEKEKEFYNPLVCNLIQDILPVVVRDFSSEYLLQIKQAEEMFPPGFAGLWTMKNNPKVSAANDSLDVITNTHNPLRMLARVRGQLAFWQEYAGLPDDKENLNFKIAGIHNLAVLHFLLGEKEESDKYYEMEKQIPSAKYFVKQMDKFRSSVYPYKFQYPDLGDSFVHPSDLKPAVPMAQMVEEAKYFVMKNGVVLLKNGETLTGVCRIKKEDAKAEGGSIVSLDDATGVNYDVFVTLSDGKEVATKSLQVVRISDGTTHYAFQKGRVMKSTLSGSKVIVFREVYPESSGEAYFYKEGEKLEHAPMLGKNKWLAKYFGDCPELVQKIENKTISEPEEIAKYYNEQCK